MTTDELYAKLPKDGIVSDFGAMLRVDRNEAGCEYYRISDGRKMLSLDQAGELALLEILQAKYPQGRSSLHVPLSLKEGRLLLDEYPKTRTDLHEAIKDFWETSAEKLIDRKEPTRLFVPREMEEALRQDGMTYRSRTIFGMLCVYDAPAFRLE